MVPELRPELRMCPDVISVAVSKYEVMVLRPKYVGGMSVDRVWENPEPGGRNLYSHTRNKRVEIPRGVQMGRKIKDLCHNLPGYTLKEGHDEFLDEYTWIIEKEGKDE